MQHLLKIIWLFLFVVVISCKSGPSDEQIQQDLSSLLGGEVTASVKGGVVTLSGVCPDEPCKSKSETSAKNIKGVKSVVNNIVIMVPPSAPVVEITPTDSLKTSVETLLSSYKTVHAEVANGVVTLTGEIKRSQLTTLMQSVQELKPKKVENKLVIK